MVFRLVIKPCSILISSRMQVFQMESLKTGKNIATFSRQTISNLLKTENIAINKQVFTTLLRLIVCVFKE